MGRAKRTLNATERTVLLVAADLLILSFSVYVSVWLWSSRENVPFTADYLARRSAWFWFSALWLAVLAANRGYDPMYAQSPFLSVRAVVRSTLIVLALYLAVYFLALPRLLPRGFVLTQAGLAGVVLSMWRPLYARLLGLAPFQRRVLIIGAGRAGQVLGNVFSGDKFHRLVGFVDDSPEKKNGTVADAPILGNAADVLEVAHRHQVAEIVLAVTHEIPPELFKALLRCQEHGFHLTAMPLMFERLTGRLPVEHVGQHWHVALPLDHPQTRVTYAGVKRAADVLISVIGLFVFVLLLPVLAVAIKLDSPGPVFLAQRRVGRAGRVFNLLKLRTMIQNAEPDGRAVWAAVNDPRTTRVGRFLRATALDEFPQLWNILKGDMSIVGPRPERPEFAPELEARIPFYRLRHAVKPGLTGWALIHQDYGRSVDDALLKLEYDLYYIRHQSLWLDLLIVARTAAHALKFRRATHLTLPTRQSVRRYP